MSVLTEKQILSRARASSLENVKNLNFWGCELCDLSVIQKMPNVEVLSLSVNSVATLKDFAHCPKLRELYLRKNDIDDIDEIGFLKNLPELRVLWLSDNPCAETQQYRATVLRNLPKLNKLDNVVVEEAEIDEATKKGLDITTPDNIPVHPDPSATKNAMEGDQEKPKEKSDGQAELSGMSLVEETNFPKMAKTRAEIQRAYRERKQAKGNVVVLAKNIQIVKSKLRAKLGIKPLNLENNTADHNTVFRTDKLRTGNSGGANILSAILLLVKELNKDDLEAVKSAIDQQLQELYAHEEKEIPASEDAESSTKELVVVDLDV